ncbi:23 kDa integral membrane protein-like [Diadema antillarum]|uniref:23 kDa integral membrane protein-like n=1 Tax=Diadema antillarum TaxID=105358 RepID=UPI003A83ED18
MVAGCAPKIAKLILFVLNVCIWGVGIALITVGSYVTAERAQYEDLFADDYILVVTGLIIGVGCFVFIVGFCGCCGAVKEGTCLLKTYWFFLLLIICMEITAGVLAFVYDDEIRDSLMTGMTEAITHYDDPSATATTSAVDGMQETFDCCGASGPLDYRNASFFDEDTAVPVSCCRTEDNITACQQGSKGFPDNPDLVWTTGCVDATSETISDNLLLLGVACFCLLAFEILTMMFACCVIDGIQKGEYS